MDNEELWKKIHVTVSTEDFTKLKEILPERGAFQHLIRRFIKALITSPHGDFVTVPLKMSALLWEPKDAND
jgi:hypothetical protein